MSTEEEKINKAEEKTAIEMIYQIAEDIKSIKQHLILLDNNIKLMSNKLNKISKLPEVAPTPKITATPGTSPPPKPKVIEDDSIGNIKVYGKIANKEKEPILGVEINIYNSDNQIIKKRKSDKEGYWEVRLMPGKYGIEYIQDGYKPINRVVNLENDIKIYEVA